MAATESSRWMARLSEQTEQASRVRYIAPFDIAPDVKSGGSFVRWGFGPRVDCSISNYGIRINDEGEDL